MAKPATPSQVSYLRRLLAQVGGAEPAWDKLTDVEASTLIDGLKARRGKPVFYGNGQFSHWDKGADVALAAARVAARFAADTGFFKPGDPVLFGKYKNKRGIIVRVFEDEKGHPSIEIEPVPKGRKKNKTMGLYKIWHDPDPPKPEEDEDGK